MSEPTTDTKAALWADPAPTTPEGQRMLVLFAEGKLAGSHAAGIRDFGQRICQIEAEVREDLARQVAALELPEEWTGDWRENIGFREAKRRISALLQAPDPLEGRTDG